jgi:hypothetical protein
MSRLARQPNPLAGGAEEFLADVDGFNSDFSTWLYDTKEFCHRWLGD